VAQDYGHDAVDLVGLVPGAGIPADVANASWYYSEGDNLNGTLSAIGVVPILGEVVVAGKWVFKGGKWIWNAAEGSRTTFHTVQGADDAARLGSGGHPFPTDPDRAHFGPGVYSWGSEAEAVAYAANKPGTTIMRFSVANDTLAKLPQAHVGGMTDDAATTFMEQNSLLWGGNAGHGLGYISRPTARGTEHYFSSNVFEELEWH
jgi:hypothetical protein